MLGSESQPIITVILGSPTVVVFHEFFSRTSKYLGTKMVLKGNGFELLKIFILKIANIKVSLSFSS